MALPPAIIAAIISAGAGAVSKTAGIAQQNAYNHPAKQLARLRKAGLPYAAYGEGGAAGAGNQSGLFDGKEFDNAAGYLSQVLTNQKDQEAINMVKLEQDMQRMKNRVYGSEVNWLLDMKGPDGITPNQITNLKAMQGTNLANQKSLEIGNDIAGMVRNSKQAFLDTELEKAKTDLSNALKLGEGYDLDNALKDVNLEYLPKMNDSQLATWAKQRGLISEQTTGKQLNNDLKAIRVNVERMTQNYQIDNAKVDNLTKWLDYDKLKEYFKSYKDYMHFVRETQKAFNSDTWANLSFSERLSAAASFAYTTISSATGQTSNILNLIK